MIREIIGAAILVGLGFAGQAFGQEDETFEAALSAVLEEQLRNEESSLSAAGECGEGGWARLLMGENRGQVIYRPLNLEKPDRNTEITMTVCLNTTRQGGFKKVTLGFNNVRQALSIGSCYMFTTFMQVGVETGEATGTGGARAEICYRMDHIEYKPSTTAREEP